MLLWHVRFVLPSTDMPIRPEPAQYELFYYAKKG